MKVHIQKNHINLSPNQESYINDKISQLDKYIVSPNSETEAWVNIGKPSQHHQHGGVLHLTVDIHVPGKSFRAEATGDDVFSITNEVQDELQREIRKFKEKIRTGQRKGFRLFKIFRNED